MYSGTNIHKENIIQIKDKNNATKNPRAKHSKYERVTNYLNANAYMYIENSSQTNSLSLACVCVRVYVSVCIIVGRRWKTIESKCTDKLASVRLMQGPGQ